MFHMLPQLRSENHCSVTKIIINWVFEAILTVVTSKKFLERTKKELKLAGIAMKVSKMLRARLGDEVSSSKVFFGHPKDH